MGEWRYNSIILDLGNRWRLVSFTAWPLFSFLWHYSPNLGLGIHPSNSPFHFCFLDLRQSVGLLGRVISSSQDLNLHANTETRTHTHTQTLNIHALNGFRTHDPGFRPSEGSAFLRPLGYRDRPWPLYPRRNPYAAEKRKNIVPARNRTPVVQPVGRLYTD
jgi:hypothetical protein